MNERSLITRRRAGTVSPLPTGFLAGVLLSQSLSAAVIVNDATLTSSFPFPGDYVLTLTQSTSGFGLLAVGFDDVGAATFQFDPSSNGYSIAEEFRLFLAPPIFSRFDPQYVSSHTSFFTNAAPAFWSVSIPLETSLFIGYWDDRTSASAPADTDNYGWVRLTNTTTGLVASASATAIGGGIIVGTTRKCPSPLPPC